MRINRKEKHIAINNVNAIPFVFYACLCPDKGFFIIFACLDPFHGSFLYLTCVDSVFFVPVMDILAPLSLSVLRNSKNSGVLPANYLCTKPTRVSHYKMLFQDA